MNLPRTNAYTWLNGLVATHSNEWGLVVSNTWDSLQRLTSTRFPDGTTIDYFYTNSARNRVTPAICHGSQA